MDSQQQIGDLLTHYEAEHLIEKLCILQIEEYGSTAWFKQDEILQRLNMQAHVNAMVKSDEFIMDSLVTFEKVKVLIYDLIETEIWKQKVLPFLKNHMLEINTYRSYIAVYHEAVVCNLLEVIMFHRTAVDSADEFLIELIDYCYRNPQSKKVSKKTVEDVLKKTREEEYQEQINEIEFKICMMCISIIRFISDYIRYLPVSVVHHLLEVNDVLCILVPLIEDKPWLRLTSSGEREKYENSKWQIVEKGEYSKIVKLEANVWIAIYNLFMDPESRKKYELNEFRKSNLLRLRKYMNEILLDQIPNLSHMLRSLEELSIMNVQSMSKNNPFIVQQIPEIREKISSGKNWNEIAEKQKREYFVNDKETLKQDMQRLADLYGQNIIDGLMEGFKCELCKKEATKRCSQCKTIWYCTRECQIAHWKDHKIICKKIIEDNKEKQQRKNDMINEINNQGQGTNISTLNPSSEKVVYVTEVQEESNIQKEQQKENQNKQQEQNLDELD